jgi:hypothetical protein
VFMPGLHVGRADLARETKIDVERPTTRSGPM